MKQIGRYPIEVFGHDFEDRSESAKLDCRQQYCRFIKGTCLKPRKSEPQVKVGICSLGSTVNRSADIHPVIICPHRFKEEAMFESIRQKYLAGWRNVKWIKEVNIGVGGNIDYVAVEVDGNDVIQDFLCVEIQAAGTTGSPYPYVQELLRDGRYSGKKHSYGINWANEFSKTMMQQAYKKGKIAEYWNRKIVFVMQDLAMEYITAISDCSGLVGSSPDLPVDFCSFTLGWNGDKWKLTFNSIKSTDIEGLIKIIGGAKIEAYPTEQEFILNITKKGLADGIFSLNPRLKREMDKPL